MAFSFRLSFLVVYLVCVGIVCVLFVFLVVAHLRLLIPTLHYLETRLPNMSVRNKLGER